ncbi:MAG TPA: hypothetical protein VKU02_26545 [Gemmataceae bacterium]|nr:hypothetical protein [Gemmataceae bacterium]
MAKAHVGAGLAAGCLLVWVGTITAATPAQILQFRPKQEGVVCSTPTPEELSRCIVKWQQEGRTWLLLDPQGRPLRRLIDTKGDNQPHIWCYYHEGIEVYREIDTKMVGEPDQYRWLNTGGMKWGVDLNKDHRIDSWRMISAEEVSQEIVQALITRDFHRLQALFISPSEIDTLGLPSAEATRMRDLQKQALTKFQNTVAKLPNLNAKTRWLHLETAPPQCLPADTYGAKQDVIHYARGTILCETDGKHDWLQTGEMIKIGLVWRIVDAPSIGDGTTEETPGGNDPALQALLSQLGALDANPPKANDLGGVNPELVTYNLKRADLLNDIATKVKPEEREQWIRQMADGLAAAAQSSPDKDKTAYQRLQKLEEQYEKLLPKSNLAAFITFREMSAENALLSRSGMDNTKVQDKWLERLAKFVDNYPKAEDAPEALMQLGMFSEAMDKETEAKKWYAHLVRDFGDHSLAAKARGALRRLEIEGKPMELAGTQLDGSPFNLASLRGKMVVVYYWGGLNKERCVGDFATLKLLLDSYGGRLALVCVNLDNTADEAKAFLQRVPAPGIHLFQPGGLEGPLATQYGILFPPFLLLVDKDGKVLSRTVQQVSSLDGELKKHMK